MYDGPSGSRERLDADAHTPPPALFLLLAGGLGTSSRLRDQGKGVGSASASPSPLPALVSRTDSRVPALLWLGLPGGFAQGFVARVAHVAFTTALMKTMTSVVYEVRLRLEP